VDVGVGFIQCGPYYCVNCGASEMGPEGVPADASPKEKQAHWYKAGRTSPHANTFMGDLVDHRTALALYRRGLLDEKPSYPDTQELEETCAAADGDRKGKL
jgi:hypothetical protein